MPQRVDPLKLDAALRELLVALPKHGELNLTETGAATLKRLRSDIATTLERLTPIAKQLDPIKHPPFVFDPTNPEIVGSLIGRTMMEQPRYPLGTLPKFYGSGVYAIFYTGGFDAYFPIKGEDTPIYVGKADPPTPDAKTFVEQGPKLSLRLREHGKSVRAASGSLDITDFDCRFLVVQSGWQRSAEDYLLNLFRPIWNSKICYGFGKHGDDPGTRANTRSPWDSLHPGRVWATREGNIQNPLSVAQMKTLIAEHFRKHPPKG